MLKMIYALFLGILLAIFVGVGISVFYTQPEAPKWPTDLNYANKEMTLEQEQLQKDFDAKQQAWDEKMKPYNRNVSIMALSAAIIFVAVGLLFEHRIDILADGAMLGGVFTLLYSMGRGFAAQDNKYSFIVTSIGLLVALGLGYLRFIRPNHSKPYKASP